MRPMTLSTSGVSVSAPAVMNYLIAPFNVGFGVVVTGTATYTVQHSFDDPFTSTYTPAAATWFNHIDVVNSTANKDGNYAFPVRAIRVNQTAGAGSTSTVIIQSGVC